MIRASLVVLAGAWTLWSQGARAQDCVPQCRDGYVCVEGECVSACNPPCSAGQVCTGAGQCVRSAPMESPPTPPSMVSPQNDPLVQALVAERIQLQRTTHRLGGPTFLAALGGVFMAGGLGGGVILGIVLAVTDEVAYGPLLGGAGLMVVGATLFGFGLWKRRLKLRRREAQQQRLDELDEEIRRRSDGLEVAVGLGSFGLRW